jgi:hypothetical protein
MNSERWTNHARGAAAPPTPGLRYSEDPDLSRDSSGSSEYLRPGVGGILCALALLSILIPGCAGNTPAPGTASLRVQVVAQPKAAYTAANHRVPTYDVEPGFGYSAGGGEFGPHPAASAASDYEKVDYSALDDVVIWLEPADGAKVTAAPPADVTVDVDPQKAVESDELTAAVSVGQHINLHNSGSKTGTVYSVSDGNEFHLGDVPPGGSGSYRVQSPGLIEIVTTSLDGAIARLYAAPTPWVRLVRAGQTVQFDNMPPGKYTIVSWHPRLPGHRTSIELSADKTARTKISVGVQGLPKAE